MLYFAYGSNMLTERLRARVPSAEPRATATLPDHGFCFHKRSRDGSGKCSLTTDGGLTAPAHGVLFKIERDGLSALDDAENRG